MLDFHFIAVNDHSTVSTEIINLGLAYFFLYCFM